MVPAVLRTKLGDEATTGLLQLFSIHQKDQEVRLLHVFQDSLDLRLKLSEEKMRGHIDGRIHESEEKMTTRIHETERRLMGEISELRKETHTGFLNVQKQITSQTRWFIALAAFLAIALKLLDQIFH